MGKVIQKLGRRKDSVIMHTKNVREGRLGRRLSVKCLLCKYEDLSLLSRTYVKSWIQWCMSLTPALGRQTLLSSQYNPIGDF